MYQITLQKDTIKKNKVIAFHIIAALLLMIMGFITLITPFSINIYNAGKDVAMTPFTWVNGIGGLFIFLGICILILNIFFSKKIFAGKNNMLIRIIEIVSFGSILIYSILQQWYLPAVYCGCILVGIILAYFIENKQQSNKVLVINDDGIFLTNTIKDSKWKWWEIEHFVAKHNVITLRNVDKAIFQFITDNNINNSEEINSYTQQNIEKNIKNRNLNNW